MRRKPYSLILLDEVEKAHADVFNILLQVLDDGRLTDSQGRTVDFRNCVIVMTSNLGSEQIQMMSEDKDYAAMKEMVLGVVSQHFRPEFINRIDDLVVFHALEANDIERITGIQVRYLHDRLQSQDIQLNISADALTFLGKAGFDPVYGARPLKRAIQMHLESPLARAILAGEFKPGDTIEADCHDGAIRFQSAQASAA